MTEGKARIIITIILIVLVIVLVITIHAYKNAISTC